VEKANSSIEMFTVITVNGKMVPLLDTGSRTIMKKGCIKGPSKWVEKMEREFIHGIREEVNIKETSKMV
jgi:hypothetical protein